jgi:two-component system cell cycle response regulator
VARILVIEDHAPSLELIVYLLEAFGHEVRSATDGAAGLAAVYGDPPDLIICDIQLPELDGIEIARRLKADPTLRDIPLVAVTASAMTGDRGSVLAAGFDVYIAKPIVPETFVQQIEAVAVASGAGGRGS